MFDKYVSKQNAIEAAGVLADKWRKPHSVIDMGGTSPWRYCVVDCAKADLPKVDAERVVHETGTA